MTPRSIDGTSRGMGISTCSGSAARLDAADEIDRWPAHAGQPSSTLAGEAATEACGSQVRRRAPTLGSLRPLLSALPVLAARATLLIFANSL